MTDRFADRNLSIEGPATHAFAITPNDSADLEEVTRAIYVGTGGDLAVVTVDGSTVTFSNLGDGSLLPARIVKVMATDTTASGLIGLS